MTDLATLNGHIAPEAPPPHDREAERAVISAMLIDNRVIPKVLSRLRPNDFLLDAHQWFVRAIANLAAKSVGADLITVRAELQNLGHFEDAGGFAYLGDLWGLIPTAANAEHHAAIVAEKAAARRLIARSFQAIRDAHDGAPTAQVVGELTADLATVAKVEQKPTFNFIASDAFSSSDYAPQWLIPRVLVMGQPGIVAGPAKGMKTSLLIDLAVSLASATPFLGTFPVNNKARVAVVSGESGFATLQETARRVCVAKGVRLADIGNMLLWCKELPTMTNLAIMHEFASMLAKMGVDVVLIDPLYLTMGDVDAKNLFEMGSALRTVSELLLGQGITPIVAHHANRQLPIGEAMELHHLAYSGVEQFARQFLLINRRKPYQSDGTHDLWVRIGGSAGHGGLWSVHVQEGVADEHFGGRTWDVTVQTINDVRDEKKMEKEDHKREHKAKLLQEWQREVLRVIDAEAREGRFGATYTHIREVTDIPQAKVRSVIESLIREEVIREESFGVQIGKGAKRICDGYIRVPESERSRSSV